jgi:L-amino acid N-acyltransferase YncA
VRIRAAAASDAEAIADLWNQVIRDTLITWRTDEKLPHDILSMIDGADGTGSVLVAEDDDGFLGFAAFSQFRPGAGYAHSFEHNVYLVHKARGQGIGHALLVVFPH